MEIAERPINLGLLRTFSVVSQFWWSSRRSVAQPIVIDFRKLGNGRALSTDRSFYHDQSIRTAYF